MARSAFLHRKQYVAEDRFTRGSTGALQFHLRASDPPGLNHKLECQTCGTIYLEIPKDAGEKSPVHCSTCHGFLGTWGELQDDFIAQTHDGHGTFELKDGRIQEK